MKNLVTTMAAMALLASAGAVVAQDLPQPVKARQGQFNILALNLGVLGGMAKGQIEFDQEVAQGAADSVVAVTMIDQHSMWPEGTDAGALDGTRAKPEIWGDMADFSSKWAALGEAATAMQAAVGEGQEALGPGLGELGGACKNCHDTYRVPE